MAAMMGLFYLFSIAALEHIITHDLTIACTFPAGCPVFPPTTTTKKNKKKKNDGRSIRFGIENRRVCVSRNRHFVVDVCISLNWKDVCAGTIEGHPSSTTQSLQTFDFFKKIQNAFESEWNEFALLIDLVLLLLGNHARHCGRCSIFF